MKTIPIDYRSDRDRVLGPWCFAGAEHIAKDWENQTFYTAHEDKDTLSIAADNVCGLAVSLSKNIGQQLNERHGCAHESRFWSLILMPWLLTLLQTSWLRYTHIRGYISVYEKTPITCQIWVGDVKWSFRNLKEFFEYGVTNSNFDYWLSSIMVKALAPSTWKLEPIKITVPSRDRSSQNIQHADSFLHRLYGSLCYTMGVGNISGVGPGKLIFGLLANAFPRRVKNWIQPANEFPNYEPAYFPREFMDILNRLIECTMPLAYSDNFNLLKQKGLSKNFVPGRLRIGTQSQWDEEEKMVSALAQEAGEYLVGVQHGGFYGVSKRIPLATYFEQTADAFFSWGWTNDSAANNGNIIPLPSPILSKLKDKHSEQKSELVLVGTHARLFRFQLQSTPTPNEWVAYRKLKLAFLETLNQTVFAKTLYRPYFSNEAVLEDQDYYLDRFPKLKILEGTWQTFHHRMMGCRLMVLDHHGTTLNIALAANVPLICFWEPSAWPLNEKAKPTFDALKKVGVLFDNGPDAAEKVNKIWKDVPGWWNSSEVQSARIEFCNRYALTDRFWWLKWASALWRM